jgi:hypothetical protein
MKRYVYFLVGGYNLTIFQRTIGSLQGPSLHWIHGSCLLNRNGEKGSIECLHIIIQEMPSCSGELWRHLVSKIIEVILLYMVEAVVLPCAGHCV